MKKNQSFNWARFEPVTSVLPVRCSTNWVMKPYIGSEVNLLSSNLSARSDMMRSAHEYIFELIHVWTAVEDESWEWSSQWFSSLSNWKEEVQIWIISYMLHIMPLLTGDIALAPNVWLHSSVGRASHRYSRRSRVRIPLKPWCFQASSFQLLAWKISQL